MLLLLFLYYMQQQYFHNPDEWEDDEFDLIRNVVAQELLFERSHLPNFPETADVNDKIAIVASKSISYKLMGIATFFNKNSIKNEEECRKAFQLEDQPNCRYKIII